MEILPFQPYKSYKDSGLHCDHKFSIEVKLKYWNDYGYTLICQEQIETLSRQLKYKKVLDAGSGSGFISSELLVHGVDVTAIDVDNYNEHKDDRIFPIRNVWHVDVIGDALDHLPGEYDAVILTWPPGYHPFARRIAETMEPGQLLFYQGEGPKGCTADDSFFSEVQNRQKWREVVEYSDNLNVHQLNFLHNYDFWTVYQKTRK